LILSAAREISLRLLDFYAASSRILIAAFEFIAAVGAEGIAGFEKFAGAL
jgi:hypothetical protein